MNKVMDWIRRHPQRTASFFLVIFTQVQGALALAQLPMSPLTVWAVNTVIGLVMAVLAWTIKNLKDETPLETPQ